MSRFADIRVEWRVEAIESSLRGKADSHELHSLRSVLDRYEHTVRELGSEVAWLRAECSDAKDRILTLEIQLQEAAFLAAQKGGDHG